MICEDNKQMMFQDLAKNHLTNNRLIDEIIFIIHSRNKIICEVAVEYGRVDCLEYALRYYSYDVNFLTDTQHLLKSYKSCLAKETESDTTNENTQVPEKPDYDEIVKLWDEIKLDTGFREKYNYMDWSYFLYLNESQLFLQLMSFYNMSSPISSLFVPVFILMIGKGWRVAGEARNQQAAHPIRSRCWSNSCPLRHNRRTLRRAVLAIPDPGLPGGIRW
jgi:hypothetical protein